MAVSLGGSNSALCDIIIILFKHCKVMQGEVVDISIRAIVIKINIAK